MKETGRLAAVLAVAATSLTVAASPVAAQGVPVIVSPADGQTVPYGFTGPFQIDMSSAPAGSYLAEVTCEDGFYADHPYSHDLSETTWTFSNDRGLDPTTCWLHVVATESWYTVATARFQVAQGPLEPLQAGASPLVFYPYVDDGYRDSTLVEWYLSRGAQARVRIRNAAGNVIRSSGWKSYRAGFRGWAWNGRKSSGRLVKPGTYKWEVTAQDPVGTTRVARGTVTTATKTVTRTITKRRAGANGRYATGGACTIRTTHDDHADIDCGDGWGSVTFVFKLPAGAFDMSWRLVGERTSADMCCRGEIAKYGYLTRDLNTYTVGVYVDDYRAFEVFRGQVTYKVRKRI